MLAIEVVKSHSIPPLTAVVTHAKLVACRCRQNKHIESRKPLFTRSIDWKLLYSVFEPLHARFDFTLEGYVDDADLNLHGDLSHCSPSDSIMEKNLTGERVFINPPWELAEHIGRYFESCRRISPTSTMDVFVLFKWAKFNELIRH
jgi:hypothetical protein